jgi:hypothetical protein
MTTPHTGSELVPANIAARHLRVPLRWLKAEVEAGRLPGLIAEGTVLLHLPTITRLLADRAAKGERDGGASG